VAQPETVLPHSRREDEPFRDTSRAQQPERSLLEDLGAAWEDGKTYVSAEVAFQKTRASYAGTRLKSVAIFGVAAAFVAVLALIGLTVGMILSLATLVGPLAATLIVVAVLLLVAFLCARVAGRNWRELSGAFAKGDERP